jgi:hypothetical protein
VTVRVPTLLLTLPLLAGPVIASSVVPAEVATPREPTQQPRACRVLHRRPPYDDPRTGGGQTIAVRVPATTCNTTP